MGTKVMTFCRTDGVLNTLGYLWKSAGSCSGLRVSETYFLRWEETTVGPHGPADDKLDFISVGDAATLRDVDHPRLMYLPYQKWFSNGSVCHLGLLQRRVVSYCWVHKGAYCLGKIGTFTLQENECWIGPVFVDRACRGLGINTRQIGHVVREVNTSAGRVLFTATNSRNYASIRGFAKCGFILVGLCRVRTLFRLRVSRTICEFSSRRLIGDALR